MNRRILSQPQAGKVTEATSTRRWAHPVYAMMFGLAGSQSDRHVDLVLWTGVIGRRRSIGT